MRFEEAGDDRGGERRVAGRIRTLGTDEVAQKTNDLLAILVDPPCELLFQSVHGVLVLRENASLCVLNARRVHCPLGLRLH